MPVGDPNNNLIENNIFIGSFQRRMDLRMGGQGSRFVRNIVCAINRGAALLATRDGHGVSECDYNLYYDEEGALVGRGAPGSSYVSGSRWALMLILWSPIRCLLMSRTVTTG